MGANHWASAEVQDRGVGPRAHQLKGCEAELPRLKSDVDCRKDRTHKWDVHLENLGFNQEKLVKLGSSPTQVQGGAVPLNEYV